MGKEKKKTKRNKDKQRDMEAESVEEQSVEEHNQDEHEASDTEQHSQKREHSDDDSDPEVKPKKKKKKKKLMPEENGDKKGKKSIRQMKKEKFLQRQAEAAAAAKDQFKSQCLTYLSQWKHDKQNWKFMKVKQMWLFKNKFSSSLVPDASWGLLLEYFESAKGNIRNLLLEDANKVIQKMDEWIESQNGKKTSEENETEESEAIESDKPDNVSYKRARDLIQCLQE